LALLPEFISRFPQINHHPFSTLYPVLKQALVKTPRFVGSPVNPEHTPRTINALFHQSRVTDHQSLPQCPVTSRTRTVNARRCPPANVK
jgi:hypothetical protein